jgi:hypothetical protein
MVRFVVVALGAVELDRPDRRSGCRAATNGTGSPFCMRSSDRRTGSSFWARSDGPSTRLDVLGASDDCHHRQAGLDAVDAARSATIALLDLVDARATTSEQPDASQSQQRCKSVPTLASVPLAFLGHCRRVEPVLSVKRSTY